MTGTYYTAGAREIIARAVVGEIWNEFPDEAVKAQAVAEYTYIKKNNEMGVSPTTALKTDVYDRIYKLVDEVLGEAIYLNYNGPSGAEKAYKAALRKLKKDLYGGAYGQWLSAQKAISSVRRMRRS